jgi:hypothetical protein
MVATPTVLDPVGAKVGATVAYGWLVNGTVVQRSLTARVERAYGGRTPDFRVTVSAPDENPSGGTVTLGRVRFRR